MQPVIIGAGIAGMSAALHLAQKNIPVTLVAPYPSVRSQSVMAEGGINAAIGPDDSPSLHFRDTWESGCRLANIKAVHHLTDRAPEVIGELQHLAMAFTLGADGKPALRPFGGQSVNRTAHADSTTGKQLVTALIYELRRYEEEGLVNRLTGFFFLDIDLDEGNVRGVLLYNRNRKKTVYIRTSQLIIAAGGLNGLFGNTTGSVANTGDVTARLFTRGVTVANAELVQYHPTTFRRPGKNMLISEAVRGAGGRLFTEIGGKRLYFMEEKFGPKGNLQPRDVVSREEYRVVRDLGGEIFLDCTGIPKDTFITSLSGFAGDCREYFNIDPTTTPLPVRYGIHYFMGGIYTDPSHRTSVGGLYSAGENACQYHGANRLGGNSLLGAYFGGLVAAETIASCADSRKTGTAEISGAAPLICEKKLHTCVNRPGAYAQTVQRLQEAMQEALAISRDAAGLRKGLDTVKKLQNDFADTYDPYAAPDENMLLPSRLILAEALIKGASDRKESRGAHNRSDYPERNKAYEKTHLYSYYDGAVHLSWREENT